jgi:5-methylcytosine-specific restriction endonuclease McrA
VGEMIRLKKYDIGYILRNIYFGSPPLECEWREKKFQVITSCNRLLTYTKGITCMHCELIGKFFSLDRYKKESPHFNLYGIDKDGEEIMMTSDHIIPRSKGGGNGLKNRQCLCEKCNSAKGNSLEEEMKRIEEDMEINKDYDE